MTSDAALHESAHAARVLEAVRERVAAAGGWLPFDEYMQLVLYGPGLGYYSAGARKFGQGGDFTTAPEMSPLFGRCLARHCVEVLARCKNGEVLELGAGSGRLAFDVLTAMQELAAPPVRYRILEVSADLRERQRELLMKLPADLAARVQWLDAPPTEQWQGALIANEVLDALPVKCFSWYEGQVLERGIALDPDGLPIWESRAAPAPMIAEVSRLRADAAADWPSGYSSELCQQAGPWIAEVTGSLHHGVCLFIDYGVSRREYYDQHRATGTLRCHYRQRAHENPFANPGLEDITAWVDFTRVAEAADAAGLDVLGYATQAAVLLGLGIERDVAEANDPHTLVRRAGEARRLLMPGEMGETFKAIALGQAWDAPLSGFQVQDLRTRL